MLGMGDRERANGPPDDDDDDDEEEEDEEDTLRERKCGSSASFDAVRGCGIGRGEVGTAGADVERAR
jgi:hypothetical protein